MWSGYWVNNRGRVRWEGKGQLQVLTLAIVRQPFPFHLQIEIFDDILACASLSSNKASKQSGLPCVSPSSDALYLISGSTYMGD